MKPAEDIKVRLLCRLSCLVAVLFAVCPAGGEDGSVDPDCGQWGYLSQDHNEDCRVDLCDYPFMTLTSSFWDDWLACTVPDEPGCVDKRPNIILIMADDMGWMDLSGGDTTFGLGSDFYETPRLEELAEQGMSFTNAYAAGSTCVPTRGAILTGMYAPRTNIYSVQAINTVSGLYTGADNETNVLGSWVTLAEALKTAGYTTATLGKYHVQRNNNTNNPTHALNQGFDFNYGGTSAGAPQGYFADANGEFDPSVGPELDAYASPGEHLTDALTDAAIDFITQHKDVPFFMYYSQYAVHTPIDNMGRADLVAKYEAKQLTDPSQIGHDDVHYAALVEGLDESVGRIMETLDALMTTGGTALADKTLLLFYSDNGGARATTIDPLRGQKGQFWEGGIREPLIARWPGYIPAGTVNHTPVISIDFYPTFAKMAGATLPNASTQPMDGVDLLPVLKDPDASLGRGAIFWHFPGYGNQLTPRTVMRSGDYKLHYLYESGTYELYNVATPSDDIGESNNLAAQMGALVTEMATEMVNWLGPIIAWDGDANDDMPLDNGVAIGLPVVP